jgi:hypothetical protein
MSERLIEKLDRFGAEAGIKEMTPEIRRFAMLVRNDMLQVWPKRDWVGLTDEEIVAAIYETEGFGFGLDNGNVSDRAVIEYVRIVESKLREKNT